MEAGKRGARFHKGLREGLSGKGTFEWNERTNPAKNWRNSIPGGGNRESKGSEPRLCSVEEEQQVMWLQQSEGQGEADGQWPLEWGRGQTV